MVYDNVSALVPWCALNRIFGFSPKIAHALVSAFGSAGDIFNASMSDLKTALGAGSGFIGKLNPGALDAARKEMERTRAAGAEFICLDDDRYPELLKECEDAPLGLYVKRSCSDLFSNPLPIAVIGTRDITSYGKEWCSRIVRSLAETGLKPLIISGLAIGTDITAHQAALENGLPTIAVMATGIDSVYPFRHGWAAERISTSPGSGLITDYPLGTVPKAINFLRRNRIIAGMAKAVILIESKRKGGGMMTCHLASSYSRDVFALPGRIDDLMSEGCNDLIRRKIAEPIADLEEFIRSLAPGFQPEQSCGVRNYVYHYYIESYGSEKAGQIADIADIISQNRDILQDEICTLSGIDWQTVAKYTGLLEADGIISRDLMRQCSINPKLF